MRCRLSQAASSVASFLFWVRGLMQCASVVTSLTMKLIEILGIFIFIAVEKVIILINEKMLPS